MPDVPDRSKAQSSDVGWRSNKLLISMTETEEVALYAGSS